MWIREFFSQSDNHLRAASEVVTVSLFSLAPLFLLPAIELRSHPESINFNVIWKAIDSGQLFLYAFGTFGMLIWLLKEARKKVPDTVYLFCLLVIFLIGLICFIILSDDPDFHSTYSNDVIATSVFFYVAYLLLYYFLLVCRELDIDLHEKLESDVNTLIANYNSEK